MFQSLPFWTLKDALDLIRGLQPESRKHGYHLCLGGSVLNKGESQKDLDLYFLSLGGNTQPRPTELINWLESIWGFSAPIGGGLYPPEANYPYKSMFNYGGLRIDVFVIGGERDEGLEAATIEERDRQLREGGVLNVEQHEAGGETFEDGTIRWRGRLWSSEPEVPFGPAPAQPEPLTLDQLQAQYDSIARAARNTAQAPQPQAYATPAMPGTAPGVDRARINFREIQRELSRQDAARRREAEASMRYRQYDAHWFDENHAPARPEQTATATPPVQFVANEAMPVDQIYFMNTVNGMVEAPGQNAFVTNIGVPGDEADVGG